MITRILVFVALMSGLTAHTATAAQATRLFEIFALRFINDTSGTPISELGRFTAEGEFKHAIYMQLQPGTSVPANAMNKILLPYTIFPAYDVFGPDGLANFKLESGVTVGGNLYFVVAVADHPKLDVGSLVNLSTRGAVAPGGEPLIGGFIIDEHPRRVLLRAVGPTLRQFGVNSPLANPVLTLFGPGPSAPLRSNDDWGTESNAAEIESTTATTGIFPLPRASNDSVLLLELPPGAYTAHVTSHDTTGGTVLLEIYILP